MSGHSERDINKVNGYYELVVVYKPSNAITRAVFMIVMIYLVMSYAIKACYYRYPYYLFLLTGLLDIYINGPVVQEQYSKLA